MIFDQLKNAEFYYDCQEGFEQGFAFIRLAMDADLKVGRYQIDGDDVYAMVQEYETKENTDTFEAHRNYIDIQCIVSGVECMEAADLEKCKESVPYDPQKDVAFYAADAQTKMRFTAESFAIFFPWDARNPGICEEKPGKVKKIVVKVRT